jgi:hypothetical protein
MKRATVSTNVQIGPSQDAGQDTDGYREFAQDPFPAAKSMAWFWDGYLPDPSTRAESPRTAAGKHRSLGTD